MVVTVINLWGKNSHVSSSFMLKELKIDREVVFTLFLRFGRVGGGVKLREILVSLKNDSLETPYPFHPQSPYDFSNLHRPLIIVERNPYHTEERERESPRENYFMWEFFTYLSQTNPYI